MVPQSIDDISLTTAAIRPSGESYREKLLDRIQNKNPSPLIDDVLKDSFGFLVYQEQIIRFLKDVCGLSGSYADTIRRAISRKNLDLIQKAMPEILDGYCSKSDKPRDVAEQEAREFLKVIEDASAYSFGYNHSLGYSLITYTCAYLRYHYPTEFIAACLNNAKNNNDITDGESFAAQAGVKILPVKFGHSGSKFVPVASEKLIYKGLSSIKYVGSDIGNALYAMKDSIPDTFLDFLKVSPCDTRQTGILIDLDFFSMYGKRRKLREEAKLFDYLFNKKNGQVVPKKSFKKDKLEYPAQFFSEYSRETEKQFFVEDMDGLYRNIERFIPDKDIGVKDILDAQNEYLGYIDYVNPKLESYFYVKDVNTKYSPRLELYDLSSGETVSYKMQTRLYQNNPIDIGDVIRVTNSQEKNKIVRTSEGNFIEVSDQKQMWLTGYQVCGGRNE